MAAISNSRFTGLWRNPDFMKFWVGQTISVIGSGITGLALPIIAAMTLNATPEQMGVLTALGQIAYLLISLPAGAWIDRTRRRPVMILSDIGRALCLIAIPLISVANLMRIEVLYVIAFIQSILTVLFELAYVAYLPVLASREHIIEANSKLETSRSGAQIAGPAIAGSLIELIGAPLAIIVDGFSFLLSAIALMLVRTQEPEPENTGEKRSMLSDIAEGIRIVSGHPLLRILTIGAALFNFFATIGNPILFLFLIDDLHLEPSSIGLIFTIAGPGTLLGALMARRISERFGLGPAIAGSGLIGALGWLLLPLAQPPAVLSIAMIALGEAILGASIMVFNINVLSLRQSITPDRLLGRVAATQRTLVLGIMPIASILGGFLGGAIGLRPTLFISVIGSMLPGILILITPVIRLKTPEQAVEQFAIK